MGAWLDGKWIDLIQSIGIIAGLVMSIAAFREEIRGRRVSTLVTLTEQHRELWSEFLRRPELHRIRDERAKLESHPITLEEEAFVKFVIVHLQTVYRCNKLGEMADGGDIQADAARFLSLPIPAAVWKNVRLVHAADFVAFIESGRSGKPAQN